MDSPKIHLPIFILSPVYTQHNWRQQYPISGKSSVRSLASTRHKQHKGEGLRPTQSRGLRVLGNRARERPSLNVAKPRDLASELRPVHLV